MTTASLERAEPVTQVAPAPAGRRATRRHVLTALTAAAVLGTTCGPAFAFWTTTGTGSAVAAAAAGPTLSATSAGVTGLFPGATVSMTVTVTNPGGRPIALVTVTPGTVSSTTAGCAASVSAAPPGTLPTVTAGGTATVTVPVTMALTAPGSCQGASFTVPVSITGRQQ